MLIPFFPLSCLIILPISFHPCLITLPISLHPCLITLPISLHPSPSTGSLPVLTSSMVCSSQHSIRVAWLRMEGGIIYLSKGNRLVSRPLKDRTPLPEQTLAVISPHGVVGPHEPFHHHYGVWTGPRSTGAMLVTIAAVSL